MSLEALPDGVLGVRGRERVEDLVPREAVRGARTRPVRLARVDHDVHALFLEGAARAKPAQVLRLVRSSTRIGQAVVERSEWSEVGAIDLGGGRSSKSDQFGHGYDSAAGGAEVFVSFLGPERREEVEATVTIQAAGLGAPSFPSKPVREVGQAAVEHPTEPGGMSALEPFPLERVGSEVDHLARPSGSCDGFRIVPVEDIGPAQDVVSNNEPVRREPCVPGSRREAVHRGQAGHSARFTQRRTPVDAQPTVVDQESATMDDDSAEVGPGRYLELFERATAGRLVRGENLDSCRRLPGQAL